MALKSFTDSNITEKSFNKAVTEVFSGVAARQKQIQELLMISFAKAQHQREDGSTVDDFRWLSTVLATALDTKGLNSKRMADWINSCVSCKDSPAPLKWDTKTKQLKKSKSGLVLVYNVTGTWFDYGVPDKVEQAFDFAAGLQAFLDRASKAYTDGKMSDESKVAYEKYLGIQREQAETEAQADVAGDMPIHSCASAKVTQ